MEFGNNYMLQIMTVKLVETSNNVKLSQINTGDKYLGKDNPKVPCPLRN